MAAITSAVVVAAGSAYAANRQGKAAEEAANAQENAANSANAEARRQFDISRQDNMPWLQAGQDALGRQQAFLDGDWSGFQNSPDYLWSLNQGVAGLDKSAAARGGLFGGGHSKDLTQFAQGNANQFANSYWNKLAGLSGTGQQGAQFLGGLGSNFSNQFGNNAMNAGNARASSYLAKGDTQAGYANAIGSGLGAYFGAGNFGTGASQPSSYGAFTPSMSTGGNNYQAYMGNSPFGAWGQGWGGNS